MPPARRARLATLFDRGGDFDEGLLTLFSAPASATGEDMAEIGCHGNPLVVERLLAAAIDAGFRLARPGEFTRRAFLNGRLDLVGAEGLQQLVEASTPEGLAIARDGVSGRVVEAVAELRAELADLGAELEARLDFPGEDLGFTEDEALLGRLGALAERADALADSEAVGRRLVQGATVALVGPVNAGKSSLFNALGGSVRALVSERPGTTRDVLERQVLLDGLPVRLLDTAGLREDPEELEAQGLALAEALTAEADLLLVVVPAHDPARAATALEKTEGRARIVVANHADRAPPPPGMLPTVAPTGQGLEDLGRAVRQALVGAPRPPGALVIASARQRDRLREVARAARAAKLAFAGVAGPAVAAEEVLGGLQALGELEGRDAREEVLDRLFAKFCVGK